MKVFVLAGLITAVTVPFAAASENEIECQVTDTRRAQAEQRLDTAPPAPNVIVRQATAQPREAVEAPRPVTAERRRNGKRVPDAELISPRGVL